MWIELRRVSNQFLEIQQSLPVFRYFRNCFQDIQAKNIFLISCKPLPFPSPHFYCHNGHQYHSLMRGYCLKSFLIFSEMSTSQQRQDEQKKRRQNKKLLIKKYRKVLNIDFSYDVHQFYLDYPFYIHNVTDNTQTK